MKMHKDSILLEIKEILSEIEGIDYAYLFGSALKRLLPDSDIDILLGGDFDFDRRTSLAMELALRLKRNVDLVLAKEASYELILNALSQGRPIVINNRDFLKRDYFKSYFLFDANTPLREIRRHRVKEKYLHD
jgi:predicted nucleotidyltransferase